MVSLGTPLSLLLLQQLLFPPSCPRSAVPFVFTVRLVRLVNAPPSRRTQSCDGYILRPALQPPSPKHAPLSPLWRAGCCGITPDKSAQLEHIDTAAAVAGWLAGCVSVRVSRRESGAAFKRGWVFLFFFSFCTELRQHSVCANTLKKQHICTGGCFYHKKYERLTPTLRIISNIHLNLSRFWRHSSYGCFVKRKSAAVGALEVVSIKNP